MDAQISKTTAREALLSMPIIVMLLLVLDEQESTRWAAHIMSTSRGE